MITVKSSRWKISKIEKDKSIKTVEVNNVATLYLEVCRFLSNSRNETCFYWSVVCDRVDLGIDRNYNQSGHCDSVLAAKIKATKTCNRKIAEDRDHLYELSITDLFLSW